MTDAPLSAPTIFVAKHGKVIFVQEGWAEDERWQSGLRDQLVHALSIIKKEGNK
jgi:hypothetical protein